MFCHDDYGCFSVVFSFSFGSLFTKWHGTWTERANALTYLEG